MKQVLFSMLRISKYRPYLQAISLCLVFITSVIMSNTSSAAISLTPLPPYLAETKGTPMVMLNLSRDHQLFYKAYNEYTDLDNDGTVETQYKHSYKYFGYFDNQRCYTYDTSNNRYTPAARADASGYCTNQWSGNFLNWSTMTRMDVVRRILYGGYRSTDDSVVSGTSLTVLERAHLPSDAHAFAKYYYGNDINKLTPFSPTPHNVTLTSATGTYAVSASELTICNVSPKGPSGIYSHNKSAAPLIYVAEGNYSLWNSNERWQCYWSEDKSASNGNTAGSGIFAASSNPSRAAVGLGSGSAKGTYIARVETCNSGAPGGFTDDEETRCKLYPSGNYKPIGLLQRYGERGEAAFGLITGSFDKNISGGVVRKNISLFTDEVDIDDGQFTTATGIVSAINNLKIFGYRYDDGTYINGDDNCNFQLTGLTEGICNSWGNPMGEMYLEALRYYAGKSRTTDFNASTPTKDIAIGLSAVTWTDPFGSSTVANFGARECRRSNIINFNASVTSYDSDQWGGASDINGLSLATVDNLTNGIGSAEGISSVSKTWSIGSNGIAGAGSNEYCNYKSVPSLADARGLCPEAPTYGGSFKVAGAALHAHTSPIRNDIAIPTGNQRAFKIDTYSVGLATGSPKVFIPVPGNAGKNVVVLPAYRLKTGTGEGGGSLVDYRVIVQTPTYGKYIVQWEDSEQGGDYDQDVWGTLEYRVVGNKVQISTDVIGEATANAQGFGYAISGVGNKDGVHFHSGIRQFSYTDTLNISVTPTTNVNASGGCNSCELNDAKNTAEYDMVGQSGDSLQDPFWYAAKYGGFDRDKAPSYTPGGVLPTAAWDSKKTSGVAGSDGTPDNYFYAVDPGELERSLTSVFQSILKSGGAAPAAATSSRTSAGGYVYVSTHSIKPQSGSTDADASGEFLRYTLDSSNNVATTPDWDGGAKLTVQNWDTGRNILSLSPTGPIRFRWNDLSASQKTALKTNPTTGSIETDAIGQSRLNWLRGDITNESALSTGLRRRPNTKLGAIINSTPWYISTPSAGYTASSYGGGYPSFRTSNTTTSAVFVGSNDGMMHAFNAKTGSELFAYVPRAVYSKLSKIPAKDFSLNTGVGQISVDGSIMAADMKISSNWRTYLFGSMGRGAKGLYALDVTSPQSVSENSTSTVVKWEFTDANDSDMGNIVGRTNPRPNGQPFQTGYMANGKWAAIYGNGVNSTNGKAYLFILFASGPSGPSGTWVAGTDYIKIATGTAGDGPNNGLSAPTAIDTDNDGDIDIVYAGDLKGNIWKFNVANASPASWGIATAGTAPLYTAKTTVAGTATAQPITTAIQPFPHPKGGYVIVAATGKSLESNDYPMSTPYVNTIYGLYDRPGSTAAITSGVSTLVQQTLTFNTTKNLRFISSNTVDYTTKNGWYFNLLAPSEATVFNPIYEDDRRVNIKSIAPESTSDGCRYDSTAFDMTLDPISGSAVKGLISGEPGAIGSTSQNSFEFASGGVQRTNRLNDSNCTPGSPGCDIPPTCSPGSSQCICDPSNPSTCVKCEPGKPCCKPWDANSCRADICTYYQFNALGNGGVDVTSRQGICPLGRLTWREILRQN
jgi:type IV pilus assembly protein PilY1